MNDSQREKRMINLKRQIPPKMCILLNKQGEKLQLTASSDLDLSLRSSAVGSERLNLLHDVHSVNHLTEHNVMSIQMRSRDLPITRDTHSYGGDEELRTVGVGTRVRHGKQSSSVVTHNEALISELGSVDGLASVAIEVLPLTCSTHAYRNISSLEHESGNHSVEDRVLVAKILTLSSLSLLSGAEATEVLGSFGNNVAEQLLPHTITPKPTSKVILPAGCPPMEISKNTLGRDISSCTGMIMT